MCVKVTLRTLSQKLSSNVDLKLKNDSSLIKALALDNINKPTKLFIFTYLEGKREENWEKWIYPTLYNDICRSMNCVNIIWGKTGILSSIGLDHILNIKPTRGGDIDARIVGQGSSVPFSPGDSRLWLASGTALQGHTLSH